MNAVGIIAEYNPFHRGHLYQLEQAKARSGRRYAVAVMSGNFVQRGEPAAFDKRLRAECALACGVDMVLELPAAFALSSAEKFARGGVRILCGSGLVSHLAFGAESDDLSALGSCAEHFEDGVFKARLKSGLAEGKSFPRARQEALLASGFSGAEAALCSSPNNILALEYLRALSLYGRGVLPLPILREGAAHDESGFAGKFASAGAIRSAMRSGDYASAFSALPEACAARLNGRRPTGESDFSALILYALRRMEPERLAALPDVSEGLENLIYRECRAAQNADDLLARLKSKRYTMARLRRILMCALLGLDSGVAEAGLEQPYIRVLGVRKDALCLLSELQKNASLPVVIRAEDTGKLSEPARNLLKFDALSGEIYSLINREAARKHEFAQPLIIV